MLVLCIYIYIYIYLYIYLFINPSTMILFLLETKTSTTIPGSTELLRHSLISRFNEKWSLFAPTRFRVYYLLFMAGKEKKNRKRKKIIYYFSAFIIIYGWFWFWCLKDSVKETKVEILVDDKAIMTLVCFTRNGSPWIIKERQSHHALKSLKVKMNRIYSKIMFSINTFA